MVCRLFAVTFNPNETIKFLPVFHRTPGYKYKHPINKSIQDLKFLSYRIFQKLGIEESFFRQIATSVANKSQAKYNRCFVIFS